MRKPGKWYNWFKKEVEEAQTYILRKNIKYKNRHKFDFGARRRVVLSLDRINFYIKKQELFCFTIIYIQSLRSTHRVIKQVKDSGRLEGNTEQGTVFCWNTDLRKFIVKVLGRSPRVEERCVVSRGVEVWSPAPATMWAGASNFSLLASDYFSVNEGPGQDTFQGSYMYEILTFMILKPHGL